MQLLMYYPLELKVIVLRFLCTVILFRQGQKLSWAGVQFRKLCRRFVVFKNVFLFCFDNFNNSTSVQLTLGFVLVLGFFFSLVLSVVLLLVVTFLKVVVVVVAGVVVILLLLLLTKKIFLDSHEILMVLGIYS